jgi:SNF2 family DNA or RNA helicase
MSNLYIHLKGVVDDLKSSERKATALDLPAAPTQRLRQMLAFLRVQDRTIVFSEYVSFLKLLGKALSAEPGQEDAIVFLHGTMPQPQREKQLRISRDRAAKGEVRSLCCV